MRRPREALVQYTHAISLAPSSALARFRRARTLMTLHLFNEALKELNELLVLAPEEANVWYMLGRCHKALGNRSETVKCFTTSLNLDAKVCRQYHCNTETASDSIHRLHNTSKKPWRPLMKVTRTRMKAIDEFLDFDDEHKTFRHTDWNSDLHAARYMAHCMSMAYRRSKHSMDRKSVQSAFNDLPVVAFLGIKYSCLSGPRWRWSRFSSRPLSRP